MELKCRQCGKAICFDSKIKSKNGKQIPLDPYTYAPHNCPKSNFNLRKLEPKSALKLLNCTDCGKVICYNPKIKSKLGKQLPLDPYTNSIHICHKSTRKQNKTSQKKSPVRILECFQCKEEIYFDKKRRTRTGKLIPLEPSSDKPHRCPKSPYEKSNVIGNKIKNLQDQERELFKRYHKIESDENTWGWE